MIKNNIKCGKNCYIHEKATLIGTITIGNVVSIWPGAVLRADLNTIVIGDETSVQENVIIHLCEKFGVEIGNRVTIGHGAIIHGCKISNNCLIGMNATILDGAQIGENCIIGANALVSQNKIIPPNSLVLGSPGKVVRQLTTDDINAITESAESYVNLTMKYLL